MKQQEYHTKQRNERIWIEIGLSREMAGFMVLTLGFYLCNTMLTRETQHHVRLRNVGPLVTLRSLQTAQHGSADSSVDLKT